MRANERIGWVWLVWWGVAVGSAECLSPMEEKYHVQIERIKTALAAVEAARKDPSVGIDSSKRKPVDLNADSSHIDYIDADSAIGRGGFGSFRKLETDGGAAAPTIRSEARLDSATPFQPQQTQPRPSPVTPQTPVNQTDAKIPLQLISTAKFVVNLLLIIGLSTVVVAVLALLLFIIWGFYLPEIRLAVMNGYSEFSEKQLPKRRLTAPQQERLSDFQWAEMAAQNTADLAVVTGPQTSVVKRDYFEGAKFFVEFIGTGQALLTPPSFVINPEKTAERVFYFEVEIFQLYDSAGLVIGFAEPEALAANPEKPPGRYDGSVGFDLVSGEVRIDDELMHTFDFRGIVKEFHNVNESGLFDATGNFYGVGVNFHTKLFFFSFNGVVLQSMSFQAQTNLRSKIYDMRKQDLLTNDEGIRSTKKLKSLVSKVQVDKKYRDQMKKTKEFPSKLRQATPAVFAKMLSKFEVNVGAFPFQLKDRELKHGLLFSSK